MNKQELIEEIKKDRELIKRYVENENYSAFYNGMETAYSAAIGLAKRLDEPKKVVIPQVVADWIKYAKRQGYGFMQSYDPIYMSYPINDGLDKWIDDNEETFAHAWLDGYEVEKEPFYYVKLPGVGYLNNADGGIKHTEKEIKAIDERYWTFAVKVDGE
ncbi:DUF1642 domain-containing protein [Enterococcus faecalis]|uniref:DUF1642 domain-containing protein n=1 Tax=Enterococcus faecalis TaxID=1351 RepID=UPI0011441969|nr:DUF1642 domain-containing protein [Enterococcus faecalis]EGO7471313.1 DUF1642 domain-containing protein [Enterococcus faecalis]EGO8129141.1 DUF1642 domain-containing protein [Enterococcus faecalis]EHR4369786.1 DUF1642 domain-containing protein [Enterococcus faecalis]EHV2922599.1 DUF1642 domain-containing protein [Enterococcus faecalis]EIM5427054.1 DUF1642 domain-containing protein [Enterococcus faecalis]